MCEKGGIQSSELKTSKNLGPLTLAPPTSRPCAAILWERTLLVPHSLPVSVRTRTGGPSNFSRPTLVFWPAIRELRCTNLGQIYREKHSMFIPVSWRLAGTEVVEPEECLDQDIDLHSLEQDHPSVERRPICFPCLSNKVTSLSIFLVDIKLALGNNPHLFTILSLEPSCRLRHPPSVFC